MTVAPPARTELNNVEPRRQLARGARGDQSGGIGPSAVRCRRAARRRGGVILSGPASLVPVEQRRYRGTVPNPTTDCSCELAELLRCEKFPGYEAHPLPAGRLDPC